MYEDIMEIESLCPTVPCGMGFLSRVQGHLLLYPRFIGSITFDEILSHSWDTAYESERAGQVRYENLNNSNRDKKKHCC